MARNTPRTGISYEIKVLDRGGWMNTAQAQKEIMDGLRTACADLMEGIDQRKDGVSSYGEDGMDHTSVFVDSLCVGEAVRRINEAGYATDEDEVGEDGE